MDGKEEDAPASPPKIEGVERELFGTWATILRNVGGLFAVIVVGLMALFNCYTTYVSVSYNKEWPSETSVFMMVVGPVICAWAWMSVNKVITTIFTGVGDVTRLREKVAGMIAPEKKDNE